MKLCKENLILNIFTLTQGMLDIYFLTLSRGVDSILDSANLLPLQLIQLPLVRSHYMKLCKENLILNIFTLTQGMLDIYFPTLSRGVDSILDSANLLPLQLNQLPLVRSHYMKLCKENLILNIFKFTQRMLDIYFPTLSVIYIQTVFFI